MAKTQADELNELCDSCTKGSIPEMIGLVIPYEKEYANALLNEKAKQNNQGNYENVDYDGGTPVDKYELASDAQKAMKSLQRTSLGNIDEETNREAREIYASADSKEEDEQNRDEGR